MVALLILAENVRERRVRRLVDVGKVPPRCSVCSGRCPVPSFLNLGLHEVAQQRLLARLDTFLNEHRDEIDGVLWLGRDGDDPNHIAYQIVPSRPEDAEDVRDILEQRVTTTEVSAHAATGELQYDIY